MADISVVMCTFNGERYVEEQLQSILDQSLRPLEVIVSDDGSTDDTVAIVSRMAATAVVPVLVHRNPSQLGFADNFLNAAGRARGGLIAFSDQDDRWSPAKLEVAADALIREKAALCTHQVRLMDSDGRPLSRAPRARAQTRVIEPLRANPWGNYLGFTMLFDASLLRLIPLSDRGMDTHSLGRPLSHDRWIHFLASTYGRTVVLDEVLADYRQHGHQLYGGEVSRSLRERLRTKLASGQAQSHALADVARHRATILEAAGPTGLGHEAAQRWRRLAVWLDSGARLYDESLSRTERVRLLMRVLREGGYRPLDDGGLGLERLAEDVLILLAKMLPTTALHRLI